MSRDVTLPGVSKNVPPFGWMKEQGDGTTGLPSTQLNFIIYDVNVHTLQFKIVHQTPQIRIRVVRI